MEPLKMEISFLQAILHIKGNEKESVPILKKVKG